MRFVTMVRETLLRAAVIGIETTAMGFCRRQERLDSSSDKGKPRSRVRRGGRGEGEGAAVDRKLRTRQGNSLLKWANWIVTESRQGWSDSTWGMVGTWKGNRIRRMMDPGQTKWFMPILGSWRTCPSMEPSQPQKGLIRVCWRRESLSRFPTLAKQMLEMCIL